MRPLSLAVAAVTVCTLFPLEVIARRGEQPSRPNIVIVFIDDMGWGDLSCFGNDAVETQNIDRLATEDVLAWHKAMPPDRGAAYVRRER